MEEFQIEQNEILCDKYKIGAILGSGGFGAVYKAQDITNNFEVAVKIDLQPTNIAVQEYRVLKELKDLQGFPEAYFQGRYKNRSFIVMQYIGPDLSHFRKNFKQLFTIVYVLKIGIQLLQRVQDLHSKNYIHRDIKPQQFLVEERQNLIYLVDFGLSRRYYINGTHISMQNECQRAGSSSFASLNTHMGIRQSRRDDLESLFYTLIYLIQGFLPWQMKSGNRHKFNNWGMVFINKVNCPIEALCKNLPNQFIDVISYIRRINFDETPDYGYIRSVFQNLVDKIDPSPLSFQPKRIISRNKTHKARQKNSNHSHKQPKRSLSEYPQKYNANRQRRRSSSRKTKTKNNENDDTPEIQRLSLPTNNIEPQLHDFYPNNEFLLQRSKFCDNIKNLRIPSHINNSEEVITPIVAMPEIRDRTKIYGRPVAEYILEPPEENKVCCIF